MTSKPEPAADERLTGAHDLALAALGEITPTDTIGPAAAYTLEDDGVVSLRFHTRLAGYPGWFWTVSVAVVEGSDPTVLEVELLPGDGALLAPDWVPWATRLAEYQAAQAAAAAAGDDAGDADDDDLDDDADDDVDDDSEDDDESDDDDDEPKARFHAGDLDGVDIDELDSPGADADGHGDDAYEDESDDDDSDEDESDDDDSDRDESDDDDDHDEGERSY